jgi:hypothetical protein
MTAKNGADPRAIFTDHCVVFIDFLGFRDIINTAPEKMDNLLQILKALQSSRSEFQITKQVISKELGSIELKAAMSAFSDNVVLSYPLERMYIDDGLNEQTAPYIVMDHARKFIADLASVAFTLGLLIRGGMTIGKLYHQEGVVFGQGLVDAYRLESEVAIYLRVVLSSVMSGSAAWRTEDQRMVKRDFDDVYYLDYFYHLIMSFSSGGINWPSELGKRMKIVQGEIQKAITNLNGKGQLKEAAKWGWFGNRLVESMNTLVQDGLSDHGLTREQLIRLGLKA